MKVILVNERYGHTRTIVLKGWLKGLLSICLLGAPVAMGYLGYQLAVSQENQPYSQETAQTWHQQLRDQAESLAQVKRNATEQLEALAVRLAMLQARLSRLDALGETVTSIAQLDVGEFDFATQEAGQGGPLIGDNIEFEQPDFLLAIAELEHQVADQAQQLEIRVSENIITVAADVIVASGDRQGYGLTVDKNHGNGYLARYADADRLLIDTGDIARKGQAIALVGSTGRSAGPHVHFEVYKHGRVVDPATYIHRTAR